MYTCITCNCTCITVRCISDISSSGTLIRRHCIPLPPPCDDQFYTVEDFNVGRQIQLYSKIFEITVSACKTS